MKKFFSLVLALAMVLVCTAVFAEAAEETAEEEFQEGAYLLHNATGETVTFVGIHDNATGTVDEVITESEPLLADETLEVHASYAPLADASHRLTLSFTTESGYSATFQTLSVEKVAIELLAADALTGATPIAFTGMLQEGNYHIVNATGGKVSMLGITSNADGRFIGINDLADGEEGDITFYIPGGADKEHCLTLSYLLEDGTACSFETLSIEDVTITLLAPDAMTGATPIAITMEAAE